jgi:hypothetical protein
MARMSPEQVRAHVARIGKPAKYRNKKTVVQGKKFDSGREASRYCALQLLQASGEISDLKRQVHIPCHVNEEHVCTYIADFSYVKRGDSCETFEDAKGHRTALYILKKKLVRACHGIEIQEV